MRAGLFFFLGTDGLAGQRGLSLFFLVWRSDFAAFAGIRPPPPGPAQESISFVVAEWGWRGAGRGNPPVPHHQKPAGAADAMADLAMATQTQARAATVRLLASGAATSQHALDRLRSIRLAGRTEPAQLSQLSSDCSQGHAACVAAPGRHHGTLRRLLPVRVAFDAPAELGALPVSSSPQLLHQHRLVELMDGAEDLPNEHGGRGIRQEAVWGVGGDQFNPSSLQHRVAGLLHHKIPGEPAGVLHEDRAGAVAVDVGQHGGEAGPSVDRISAAHCGVVVAPYELEAPGSGTCPDGRLLAGLAVFVLA